MSIAGTDSVSTSTNNLSTKQKNVLGKEDFLNLLVTQLKNQDPLKPIDSTEFTAQLAQFSSLEGIQNINDTLKDLALYQTSTNNALAVSLIGKTVKADGNAVSLAEGAAEDLIFDLAENASPVSITIYDSTGKLVRRIDAGALGAGEQTLPWDGKDSKGDVLPDGEYTFAVVATNAAGQSVTATTYIKGAVTGVVYKENTAYLSVGTREIPLGKVVEVSGNDVKAF